MKISVPQNGGWVNVVWLLAYEFAAPGGFPLEKQWIIQKGCEEQLHLKASVNFDLFDNNHSPKGKALFYLFSFMRLFFFLCFFSDQTFPSVRRWLHCWKSPLLTLYNSYFISFCCVWCLMSHRSLFDTTLTFIIIMRCSDSACRISGISACDEEFIISSLNFFYSEPFYFTAETCSLIPLKFLIESSWSSPGSYRYHENTQISLPLKEQFTQQWKASHLLLLMM